MHLELIGTHVEMVRDVPILGRLPNPLLYLGTVLVSLVVYRFFQRYKAIFVDVI